MQRAALIVSVYLMGFVSASLSAETDESREGLVDRTHTLISDSFNDFIYQIDDTLAGEDSQGRGEGNSARLVLDLKKREGEGTELKGRVKVRAALPRFERRMKLLIESEDDLKADSDAGNTDDNAGLSLAFRFIRDVRENGNANLDLGARWRDNQVQLFGRVSLSFDYYHKKKDGIADQSGLISKFSNRFFQFSSSGFENRFRYDLSKALNKDRTLVARASTSMLWQKTRDGMLISETIGLYKDLGGQKTLALEALASYTTRLNGDDTERFRGSELRVRYRRNAFRNWFFLEVWPGVTWYADNGYREAYSLLLRAETVFGDF